MPQFGLVSYMWLWLPYWLVLSVKNYFSRWLTTWILLLFCMWMCVYGVWVYMHVCTCMWGTEDDVCLPWLLPTLFIEARPLAEPGTHQFWLAQLATYLALNSSLFFLQSAGCGGIIFVYTVKICQCDWFNKNLNNEELGRISRAERTLGRRAGRQEEMLWDAEWACWG